MTVGCPTGGLKTQTGCGLQGNLLAPGHSLSKGRRVWLRNRSKAGITAYTQLADLVFPSIVNGIDGRLVILVSAG